MLELRHGAARTRPLPIQLRDDPRDWLDRLPPRTEVIERLIRELKWFLGADYDRLAACAVYPRGARGR